MTTTSYYSPPLSQIAGGASPAEYAVFQIGGSTWAQASAGTGLNTYVTTAPDSAINSAISALNGVGGGTISIRAGTYTLSSPIILNGVNNISIVGENASAVILTNASSGFSSSLFATLGIWDLIDIAATKATTYITLKDLQVKLSANSANYGAAVSCNWNVNSSYTIDQINFLGLIITVNVVSGSATFPPYGIETSGNYSSNGGPTFTNSGSFSRINVVGCIITLTSAAQDAYGIYASNSTQRIERCYLSGWGKTDSNPAILLTIGDFWVDKTVVTGCQDGIDSASNATTYVIITDCIVTNCANIGMQLLGQFVFAIGCEVKWCKASGINLAPLGFGLAQGCMCRNNNQAKSATASGIIVGGDHSKIIACDLSDDQATATQAYGLYVNILGSGYADITVIGCNFTGNKTAAVGSVSGLNNVMARDNQGWNLQATNSITVTVSPFTYTNNDGYPENIAVVGGSVSEVDYVRGTSIVNTGATAGLFSDLQPTDSIKVTYSFAPTMSKVPQ